MVNRVAIVLFVALVIGTAGIGALVGSQVADTDETQPATPSPTPTPTPTPSPTPTAQASVSMPAGTPALPPG